MKKKLINIIALGIILSTPMSINANTKLAILEEEIKGSNRYETAGKISDRQTFSTAILVNGDNSLADGLSASGLSGVLNAPILLTQKDNIPNETLSRLSSVKKVYIVGGENAISSKVESQIKNKGISIKRLKGSDRLKTSYAVAKEISEIKPVSEIYLANGYKGEADAMSIGSVANKKGQPIILTNGKEIPFNTSKTKNYVIGGSGVMSNDLANKTNATRLHGKDRFETNKKVNKYFYPNANEFILTKGWNLVDALTSSSLGKPIVLVEKGTDKSILKGASSLIRVGGIDSSVYQECLNSITDTIKTPPTVKGNNVTIKQGEAFNNSMLGASATDCEGKAIAVDITGDKVDTNRPGTYTLVIKATDQWGLTASKTVTVTVEKKAETGMADPNSAQFKAMVSNEMYALVNAHRTANGQAPLQVLGRLEGMANAWSKCMADTGVFDHTIGGQDAPSKFPQFGNSHGENIALVAFSPNGELDSADAKALANKIFSAWRNSAGHNAAMLDEYFQATGFGFHAVNKGGSWSVYATLEFVEGTKSLRTTEEEPEVKEDEPVVEEQQNVEEQQPTEEVKPEEQQTKPEVQEQPQAKPEMEKPVVPEQPKEEAPVVPEQPKEEALEQPKEEVPQVEMQTTQPTVEMK
ncbi:cell wall-binding repeat-containing protein [Romboutsia sp. 1001216sp1]|uniref:cell wall-binding repeat-containing protein n=1 Tax=unclassified Romboutsia TaxID=2626894 RepID=UPI00189F08B2|nr:MULTISPECIES: cell wall-binding repeat-containing protein [unclassified Romboutsia]MDB8803483.1 cell wall-binding repeat-containing protein [Romboutsia sp. 1001216sp1]MDB8814853.1 cell wall-binding repeat-containing protein [Romboutsia sp. 1001216sp1]